MKGPAAVQTQVTDILVAAAACSSGAANVSHSAMHDADKALFRTCRCEQRQQRRTARALTSIFSVPCTLVSSAECLPW